MAYILGRREFFGLEFRVDRRVLIPRPDTEALVEVALERTRAAYMFGNALDLCTGSGCVAVAFAKQRPTWRVTATDISEPALGLAFENAQRLGTVFGMTFSAGDLFAAVAAAERFELITANPPYVSAPEVLKLDRGIRDFEPAVALGSGADGLDLIRRIVTGAAHEVVVVDELVAVLHEQVAGGVLHAQRDDPLVVLAQLAHQRREVRVARDDHEQVDVVLGVAEVQRVYDEADVGGVLARDRHVGDLDELEGRLVQRALRRYLR
jgi:HemK-like putative methylase